MGDDLKINLTTHADTSGAKQTTSAIKEVEDGTKALNKELAREQAEAARVSATLQRSAEAMRDAGGAAAGLRENVSSIGIGLRSARGVASGFALLMQGEFSLGLRIAAAEMKGLNLAMKANPMGLLAAAVGVVIGVLPALYMHLRSSGDSAKTMGDKAEGAAGSLEKVGTKGSEAAPKIDEVATAAANAEKGLKDAEQFADSLEKSLDALAKSASATQQALNELGDAQTDLQLAQIDRDQVSGKLTPAQATAAKKKVENDNKVRQAKASEDAAGMDVREREGALQITQDELKKAQDASNPDHEAVLKASVKDAAQRQQEMHTRLSNLSPKGYYPEGYKRLKGHLTSAAEDADREKQQADAELAEYQQNQAKSEDLKKKVAEQQKGVSDAKIRQQAAQVKTDAVSMQGANDYGKAEGDVAKEAFAKFQEEQKNLQEALAKKRKQSADAIRDEAENYEALVSKLEAAKVEASAKGDHEAEAQIEDQLTKAKLGKSQLEHQAKDAETPRTINQKGADSARDTLTKAQGDAASSKAREEHQKEMEQAAEEAAKEAAQKAAEAFAKRHPRRKDGRQAIDAHATESPQQRQQDYDREHFEDNFHPRSDGSTSSSSPAGADPFSQLIQGLKYTDTNLKDSASGLSNAGMTMDGAAGHHDKAAGKLENAAKSLTGSGKERHRNDGQPLINAHAPHTEGGGQKGQAPPHDWSGFIKNFLPNQGGPAAGPMPWDGAKESGPDHDWSGFDKAFHDKRVTSPDPILDRPPTGGRGGVDYDRPKDQGSGAGVGASASASSGGQDGSQLAAAAGNLQSQAASLGGAIGGLNGAVGTLAQAVSGIHALASAVTTLSSTVNGIQSQVSQIQTQMS